MSHLKNRIGEQNINNSGQLMTIVDYINNKDITVQFDDGRIVEHMTYTHFKKGDISGRNLHATKAKNARAGMTMKMSNGLLCTIIEYNNSKDMLVRFENGYETKARWQAFMNGQVLCLNKDGAPMTSYMQRIGERQINKQDEWMEVISYTNANDITVKFDAGPIVEHAKYNNFREGNIICPGISYSKLSKDRVGMTNIATNGQKMTITEYISWNEITVLFEDGTLVKTAYNQFQSGKVTNPNNTPNRKNDRTGFERRMNNGLLLTVINYRTTSDVDAVFEDGTIVKTAIQSMVKGAVAHPNLSMKHAKNFCGFDGIYGFSDLDKVYYHCKCRKCGLEDILNPQQMMEHYSSCC